MNAFLSWLDHRTGYKRILHESLYENIPGGARWRYVWGSTLVFAFAAQMITGIFLWMAYSPSAQTAWESVYFIQNEMWGGWLLRGIHHFMAQAMVVLLALHLMQVVIDGAYRAPREINFWLGLILMQIVLGLALTGYLLPWDQKGYWATQVATKIMGTVPLIGDDLKRLVVGGSEYGHHTLTRFFALHAGLLPGLLIFFLVLHLWLFRRHGITAKDPNRRPAVTFWPDQVLRDGVACFAVLLAVVFLAIFLGAELGAPADPASQYDAARPEWYFLFLFEFLKYFPGELEFLGAVVIPGLLMLVLVLMPFIARVKGGHTFNVAFLVLVLLGAGALTVKARMSDTSSESYQTAVHEAEEAGHRAAVLASRGIPPQGALHLMRTDPKTQGKKVFEANCAACHSYVDADGHGIPASEISAPNLYRVGSRDWLVGLLDPERITSEEYFGKTAHAEGEMVDWVKGLELDDEQRRAVAAYVSHEAGLPYQEKADPKQLEAGKELFSGDAGCADCHVLGDRQEGEWRTAPDLTGYMSRRWLVGFISNPAHERFYGENNDRMPQYGLKEILTPAQIGYVADWLREDYDGPPKDAPSAQEILAQLDRPADEAAGEGDAGAQVGSDDETSPEAQLAARLVEQGVSADRIEQLVQNDPLLRGPALFKENCARCHNHADAQGAGIVNERASAPNLYHFASRDWLAGLLDPEKVDSPEYFGKTKHKEGEMVGWVKDLELPDDQRRALAAYVSHEANLPYQEPASAEQLAAGKELFSGDGGCTDCHILGDREEDDYRTAPDLTGYGSRRWLVEFIRNPEHERFYGENNDRMPAFGEKLGDRELELLADWIRGDYVPPAAASAQ